jgi:hypothetical protein
VFGRRRASRGSHDRVVDLVEWAKAELVQAVPSPRGIPGRPVADAVAAFEDGLRRAGAELGRQPAGAGDVRNAWTAGIEESLVRAERLRLEGSVSDYEALVNALGDLMAPLDVFHTRP